MTDEQPPTDERSTADEQPPAEEQKPDDRSTLWGAIGILLAPCCVPLGFVFPVLSLIEARRAGRRPTLAYVGLALSSAVLITYVVMCATGRLALFGTRGF